MPNQIKRRDFMKKMSSGFFGAGIALNASTKPAIMNNSGEELRNMISEKIGKL